MNAIRKLKRDRSGPGVRSLLAAALTIEPGVRSRNPP